jgi:hypothetical protein
MTRFKFLTLAMACGALASFAVQVAHAQLRIDAHAGAVQTAQGALGARSGFAAQGSNGVAAGRRGFVADGQGNVDGAAASGFTTAGGAQGGRSARFSRSADGSTTASANASASGQNGSAERSGSWNRNADGSASGQRQTTLTNSNTGNTFDASTTYTKGSGFSRSASCKDAAGNTVTCGAR